MAGARGWEQTYRLSTNIRVAKYTALIQDPTDTNQTNWFISQPPASTPWLSPVAGVTILNFFEPNFFAQEDTNPATITGVAPQSPYVLGGTGVQDNGPFITVQYAGIARCYASSASSITSGSLVVIGDQYGRVQTPANLGVTGGTKVFPVGIAIGSSSALNTVIWVNVSLNPVPA